MDVRAFVPGAERTSVIASAAKQSPSRESIGHRAWSIGKERVQGSGFGVRGKNSEYRIQYSGAPDLGPWGFLHLITLINSARERIQYSGAPYLAPLM